MKKCFIAALCAVFAVAAMVAIPSIEFLSRDPAISLARYQHHYFARKQWMADLRTMVSCAEFLWSFSHEKLTALADGTNQPPARAALSTTNPVAMNLADDHHFMLTGNAPIVAVVYKRLSHQHVSVRETAVGRNSCGTNEGLGSRTNQVRLHARPAVQGDSVTNLQGA